MGVTYTACLECSIVLFSSHVVNQNVEHTSEVLLWTVIVCCIPQLDLWGSPSLVRFLRMWPFFNPTIEVATFRLCGSLGCSVQVLIGLGSGFFLVPLMCFDTYRTRSNMGWRVIFSHICQCMWAREIPHSKCKIKLAFDPYEYHMLLLIHMSTLWIYIMSCVHPASQLASHLGMAKTFTLDITHKLFNQIFSCLPYLQAPLTSNITYHFIDLDLARGHKVSAKQNLLASFSID